MGKKLIIKGADFSANALESSSVVWSQTTLLKPFIVTLESSSLFGQLAVNTSSDNYKKLARLGTTIQVPTGKTLRMKVTDLSDNRQYFWLTTVSYQNAWTGDTIPSSALPATSADYPAESYSQTYVYTNNSGSTQNINGAMAIQGVANMTPTNYKVFYYVE